jgi:leucyl-tRNA synthetase
VALPAAGTAIPADLSPLATDARRMVHKTVAAIGEDLERFRFNKAVARIRELSNALEKLDAKAGEHAGDGAVLREGLEVLVRLIGPMMPHLAEELWSALGHDTLLVDSVWPVADAALATEDTATVAVQVNGKLRATLHLPKDIAKEEAEALALAEPNVQRALEGKPVRKVIVVPNRVINVVI